MSGRARIALLGFIVCTHCLVALPSANGPGPMARAASQARGTVSVHGTVVNASLAPLGGAVVVLEQNGRGIAKVVTDAKGGFRFTGIVPGDYQVRTVLTGYTVTSRTLRVPVGATSITLPIVLSKPGEAVTEAKVPPPTGGVAAGQMGGVAGGGRGGAATAARASGAVVTDQLYRDEYPRQYPYYDPQTGEKYAPIDPNRFQSTRDRPLSTFGADVDTASYSNVRRFLSNGQRPPRDAVRVEELINYFQFGYATPRDGRPIALTTEIGDCPWAPGHKLVLIGARAASTSNREVSGRNIVLLIDVSGSMAPPERLPLIKTALSMFVDTLATDDTLSIVTYAGSSGVALRPTPASRRDYIQGAISRLNASGSTNGAQGLTTAYRIAREAYIPGGVNRVILATDGDFNVGITSQQDLLDLIERERESGVFLSVFGVGSGNLKDATMEMLADRGNGHYAYLDSLQEARRVLIREAGATLETVAKDVKFQVEFNPSVVSAWKLIGYENRALSARDFNNDRKDAGEVGAGQTVTVLYEIIPAGVGGRRDDDEMRPDVDPLRYQAEPRPARTDAEPAARFAGEWMMVKARYKLPDDERSQLISVPIGGAGGRAGGTGRQQHLPLASAVAEYGLLLRDQPQNEARWDALLRRVERLIVPQAQAQDVEGFRELVAIGKGLARIR